jgi:hypothetical protein
MFLLRISLRGLSGGCGGRSDSEEAPKFEVHWPSQTLGGSHPSRPESERRLALIYRKLGQEQMEELYWHVLKGTD